MGGEQGLGAQIAAVAYMLHDSPGNAHAVVGGGSASDFIQDQQAL